MKKHKYILTSIIISASIFSVGCSGSKYKPASLGGHVPNFFVNNKYNTNVDKKNGVLQPLDMEKMLI